VGHSPSPTGQDRQLASLGQAVEGPLEPAALGGRRRPAQPCRQIHPDDPGPGVVDDALFQAMSIALGFARAARSARWARMAAVRSSEVMGHLSQRN
jgi:hypothetical protein